MIRPPTFTSNFEPSDSERQDHGRLSSNRDGPHIRSDSKVSSGRIGKRPLGSRQSSRSSRLRWDLLQDDDTGEALSNMSSQKINSTLACRNPIDGAASSPIRELPLSDPKSWVWQEKRDAAVAVAIDAANRNFRDVSRPRGAVSKNIDLKDRTTDLKFECSKENSWLDAAETTLLLPRKSKSAWARSSKQTSINNFFGKSSNMAKRKAEPAATRPKKVARAAVGVAPAEPLLGLRESTSPFATDDDETLSNKCHHDRSQSAKLTPPSSAVNTPEPDVDEARQGRLPRSAKKFLSKPLIESDSELDAASESDFHASESESDVVTEIASSTDDETENSDVDEDAHVILPAAKRIKLNVKKAAREIHESTKVFSLYPYANKPATPENSVDEDNLENDITETKGKKSEKTKSGKDFQYTDGFTYKVGIDQSLKPICKINDIFGDLVDKALGMGLRKVTSHLKGRKLKVATMCSGTESPLLAMQLVSHALKKLGEVFEYDHLFSAEIVPYKQAYIERNFRPSIIYRDIKELSIPGATSATTAYGARVNIPDGVDLLVAGFSCVDFSNLNNNKKTLKAGGESGDTLHAILDYAVKYRPKIMVLENVDGAPWVAIRDKLIPKIGYAAEWLRVDTKNYYVPQTRMRGYMICVDKQACQPSLVESTLSTWKDSMIAFRRPASCPVEAFLLDEDDPRAIRGRAELANSGRGERERTKAIDWARCHGRHQDYRAGLFLGQKRPLTNWEDGGSCRPSDYMWQDWMRNQVERVWDTIEIAWLRNLNRGFDSQYKSRLLELSQNVDRVTDNGGAGISGCITPTGIPFSTIRGGPLIGLEALSLQGLPIDQLQLTREKQAQLQDLAGNAMSSTVIGPAILAALIAGYRTLTRGIDDPMGTEMPSSLSKLCGEDKLVPFDLDLADYRPTSVDSILEAATKSIRFCLCEGRAMTTTTALQQCSLCKHTSCINCGGNPTHKYVHMKHEVIARRLSPTKFEDFIKMAIPMKFIFSALPKTTFQELERKYQKKIDSKSWNATIDRVSKALSSELNFCSIKRSELWTICYESENASMELVLSYNKAEWRLYAKPAANEPVNSDVRKLLSRPVARMQPVGADIVKGMWQFWLPNVYKFNATIRGSGVPVRSFENVHGIGKYAETEVWKECFISVPGEALSRLDVDISGKYTVLQNCGTALGSLHIQAETAETSAPLFLFLDPGRIQEPKYDHFAFSSDKRRLNYGESRSVVARVDASWRPQKLEKVADKFGEQEAIYTIDGAGKNVTLTQAQLPETLTCYVDGYWVDLSSLNFDASRDRGAKFRRIAIAPSISKSEDSCEVGHVVLSCEGSLAPGEKSSWQWDDWVEIPLTQYKEFFTAFAWLTQKACNFVVLQEWQEGCYVPYTSCHKCAPDAPGIKWRLEAPKVSKGQATQPVTAVKTNQNKKSRLTPFEDPEEAAAYEAMLKNRCSPLVVQVHIDKAGLIHLNMAVNPLTLMHRAFEKLISFAGDRRPALSWRLCTNESLRTQAVLPAFTLKNNNRDPSADRPPGFLFILRPEQSRSLAWMIQQESEEVEPFIEEEVEEASIPQIGWRAEGRARMPIRVRGGVLADQVGYGKTVTTLALIDTQRSRDLATAERPVNGRIPLKATLILVPPQLPDQWHREINKFLRKNAAYTVLVIKSIGTLRKLTIAQFQNADIIIISWKVCEGDAYQFDLAQFAGVVELPNKPARRPAAVWYDDVLTQISENVDELKTGGRSLQTTIDRKLEASKRRAAREETYVPSKRLRGEAYQKAKQNPATGTKRTHGTAFSEDSAASDSGQAKVDSGVAKDSLNARKDVFGLGKIAKGKMEWKSMTCPLLELFQFRRLVIDEYTYYTGQESLTIPKLRADFRWILSATPPLRDFADVKSISKFLGINLGIDDLTPGIIKAANIRELEKERTEYEQFQSFKMSQSAAWHENRHHVAQRFLDQFVRQNIADIEAIKGSTHLVPIVLPAAERAIYLELNQLLAGNEFKLNKSKLNSDNDRARRIREILGNSESAGEALMKSASHFTLDDLNQKFKNAPEACDIIVKLRRSQYKALTADFKRKLKQAEWLKKACSSVVKQYALWKGHVSSNQFGDAGVMEEIHCMLRIAETDYDKRHWVEFYVTPAEKAVIENAAIAAKAKKQRAKEKKAARRSDSEDEMTDDEDSELNGDDDLDNDEDISADTRPNIRRVKPEGFDSDKNMERAALALRDVTNDLRKLSTELVSRRRCLRFFECVRKLQRLCSSIRESENLAKECFCSKCGAIDLDPEKISILSQCGHAICHQCLDARENSQDDCPVAGCNAVNKQYQIIKGPELGIEDDKTRVGRHYGRKLEEIIQLIRKIPRDEQILLFVQFVDLMKTITCAMEEHGITYSTLGQGTNASKALTEFQTNLDTATKRKVLILNIGDASAAGSNLTNANHVIFVSPFLTESQQNYDQAMTQAMGRARRYGQMKPVHVYNFISLKTIDVDTVQLRSGKVLAEDVAPAPEYLPFDSFTASTFGLVNATHGEKGEFGSAETSKLLIANDDA